MSTSVFHSNHFQVNEAWIVFKLNDAPIPTATDGDFNLIALMDAASCFILCTVTVSTDKAELAIIDAKQLLKKGKAHKQVLPSKLLIPKHLPIGVLAKEAENQGITVVYVLEKQLLSFIDDPRKNFKESFSGDSLQ
jgi:hypothetical protein